MMGPNTSLVPFYLNHIMFAHGLCHSQIEYLSNSIDFSRKDRAKRYHKSSIFNSGLSGLGDNQEWRKKRPLKQLKTLTVR